MDFVRALTFPFDDDEWPAKVILGTLLSLVPFFAPGYQVRVARNVIRGQRRPLPNTNELGQVFVDGIMAALALMLYLLPVILVCCVFVFPALLASDNDFGFLLFCTVGLCISVLALLYLIPALALYWVGVIRYAETGSFSSFLQIGALWRDARDNMGLLSTLLLYTLGIGMLGALVAPVFTVTVVGGPLLVFYFHIATGHLIGQAGALMAPGG